MALIVKVHAIRRYLERVEKFCERGSDHRVIKMFEAATGLREGQIVERMLRDVEGSVPATVLFNGTRRMVRGTTARYVIDRGAIVTCYTGNEAEERREERRDRRTSSDEEVWY